MKKVIAVLALITILCVANDSSAFGFFRPRVINNTTVINQAPPIVQAPLVFQAPAIVQTQLYQSNGLSGGCGQLQSFQNLQGFHGRVAGPAAFQLRAPGLRLTTIR